MNSALGTFITEQERWYVYKSLLYYPGPGLKFLAQTYSHEWVNEWNGVCYRSLLMRITPRLGHRASGTSWRLGGRMSFRKQPREGRTPQRAGGSLKSHLAALFPSLGLRVPILLWRDDTDELWSISSINVSCFYDPSSQLCVAFKSNLSS